MIDHKKYTCPMHPEVVKDAPGKCPICGMASVPMKESHQSRAHHHPTQQGSAHSHDQSGMSHKEMDHGSGGHAHHEGI